MESFFVMLPFQLWGTFLTYPRVTTVAFQVFDCESFGDGTSCACLSQQTHMLEIELKSHQ